MTESAAAERSEGDSERKTWSSGGHLTVQREVNDATNIVEVWEIEHFAWTDEDTVGSYDFVNCHVAKTNDVPKDGVPNKNHAVVEQCTWEEVPDEVRREFQEQAERISTLFTMLEEDSEVNEDE
jgi:hypothetical protein